MLWPQQQSLPKNKFPENRLIVEIESCENCESHAHIAGHYQKKYQYFYKQIQRKLYSIGILVQKKHRTLDLFQLLEMSTVEQKNSEVIQPRVGAFEIYFKQELIFSKLQSNKWPNPQDILKKIIKIQSENKNKREEGELRMKKQAKLQNALQFQSKKNSLQYIKYIQSKNRLHKMVQNMGRQILSRDSARNRQIYHSVELKPRTQERNATADEYSHRFKNFMTRELKSARNQGQFQSKQNYRYQSVQGQKNGQQEIKGTFIKTKLNYNSQKQPQSGVKIYYLDYNKRLSQKLYRLQNLQTQKEFVQIYDIATDAIDQNVRQIKMERPIDEARRQLKSKNRSREHQ